MGRSYSLRSFIGTLEEELESLEGTKLPANPKRLHTKIQNLIGYTLQAGGLTLSEGRSILAQLPHAFSAVEVLTISLHTELDRKSKEGTGKKITQVTVHPTRRDYIDLNLDEYLDCINSDILQALVTEKRQRIEELHNELSKEEAELERLLRGI